MKLLISPPYNLTLHRVPQPDRLLERALYRIARKHAGQQRGGWICRVEVLHEKTGSDAQPKEFNR
ncbi:replication initiator protein A, partial [Komagataeibacter sp. NFXK3]